MNFKAKEGKGGHTFILKFIDKGTFHSCRGFQNTNFFSLNIISSLVNEKLIKMTFLLVEIAEKEKKNWHVGFRSILTT